MKMDNDNTILIKSKDGRLKTVSLGRLPASTPVKADDNLKMADDSLKVKTEVKERGATADRFQLNKRQPIINVHQKQDNGHKNNKRDAQIKEEITKKPSKPQTPAFYFAVEDEEEVNKFRDSKKEELRKKREQLIKITASEIADHVPQIMPTQKVRLEKVIISRLHQARTLIEIKEALIKTEEKGGVGLGREQAQQAIKEIENERVKLQEMDAEKMEKIFKEKTRDKTLKAEKVNLAEKTENKLKMPAVEVNSQQPFKVDRQPQWQASINNIKPAVSPNQAPVTQDVIAPKTKRLIWQSPAPRPLETKIKKTKKTMGPIDELAALDLEEFRSLGQNTKERVNKIYEKINLLEEESVSQKVEGIRAWKSSSVYKEYVRIGEESLVTGEPVEAILQKHNNLSLEEFEAIADLNEQLNY